MIQQLINDERFTNIQRAQAGLTKIFLSAKKQSSFYRVMKNDEPLGVLVPENLWRSLTEDLEALSSPMYRARLAKARSSTRVASDDIRKIAGL